MFSNTSCGSSSLLTSIRRPFWRYTSITGIVLALNSWIRVARTCSASSARPARVARRRFFLFHALAVVLKVGARPLQIRRQFGNLLLKRFLLVFFFCRHGSLLFSTFIALLQALRPHAAPGALPCRNFAVSDLIRQCNSGPNRVTGTG